jgi:hypothetical protein
MDAMGLEGLYNPVLMLLPKYGDVWFRIVHNKDFCTWASASCDLELSFWVSELHSVLRLNYSYREIAAHYLKKGV